MSPRKFRIHFNRINMQRGNPNVWTVHFSDRCIQCKEIEMHGDFNTVFSPTSRQPRAYFTGRGTVQMKGSKAIVTSNQAQ